jgi:hypothetical protein
MTDSTLAISGSTLTNHQQISHKDKQNQAEFKQIFDKTHKKLSSSEIASLEKSKISEENGQVGTDLALKKEIKEYAKFIEKQIYSSMWQAAYSSVKDKDSSISDTLFRGQYISEIINQSYGEDLGPIAESLYEKLVIEYGNELGEVPNDTKGVDKEL